jgi:hypothetical protein
VQSKAVRGVLSTFSYSYSYSYRIFSTLLFLILFWPHLNHADIGDNNGTPRGYPPIEILEVLSQVNSGNPAEDIQRILILSPFAYAEVFEELFTRLEMEIYTGRVGHGSEDIEVDVLKATLESMINMLLLEHPEIIKSKTLQPNPANNLDGYIQRIINVGKMIEQYPDQGQSIVSFMDYFRNLYYILMVRPKGLTSLYDALRKNPLSYPDSAIREFKSSMVPMADLVTEIIENPLADPAEDAKIQIQTKLRRKLSKT